MTDGELAYDRVIPTSQLARDVGLARQVMAADLVVHDDGSARGLRAVNLQNDRISLEVLVDRGLDIGRARIEQMPLAWSSPTGLVAPALVEARGSEFLRGFHGGLLTTCGLDHIGHPAERDAARFSYESRAREELPMHGRVSGLPGMLTGHGVVDTADGLEAFVSGTVSQVAVFGEHLVLSRRISIRHGSTTVRVEDRVTNAGYAPSPLAVMYHVNVGWPAFAPGARVVVSGERMSGDAPREILPPTAGAAQAVTIYTITPDDGGAGSAEIVNPQVSAQLAGGVRLRWDGVALPSLVRWQVANVAGHYVLGLEPCTGIAGAEGLAFPTLEPGETRELGVSIALLKTPALR